MCHQEAYSNVLSDAHSNVSSDAHSNVSRDDTFKRIYSFLNILSSLLSVLKTKKHESFTSQQLYLQYVQTKFSHFSNNKTHLSRIKKNEAKRMDLGRKLVSNLCHFLAFFALHCFSAAWLHFGQINVSNSIETEFHHESEY